MLDLASIRRVPIAGAIALLAMSGGLCAQPEPQAGVKTVKTPNGNEVQTRADGSPRDVRVTGSGMEIHHALNGNRRVTLEQADHSRIVAERGGRGHIQHSFVFRGHEFSHRTYVFHGVAYDRFYRRYRYHGIYFDIYAPVRYYPAAFYAWADNPWSGSVPYPWGWAGNRWYAHYGFYFAPYPAYSSPSLWLTDYLLSSTLAAAYQGELDAGLAAPAQSNAGGPILTDDVKQLLSEEVRRQVALEKSEARTTAQNAEPDPHASGIDRLATDGVRHIFVAGGDLDIAADGGQECSISTGDVFVLSGAASSNVAAASLMVLASKGGQECPQGSTVEISFRDLQDMQNHMRETLDLGLADLDSHQGQGNLPAEPPAAKAAPMQAAFVASAPPRDSNAAAKISEQSEEADKVEQETLAQLATLNQANAAASRPVTPASAPPTISRGQTVEEVTTALGAPTRVLDLGTKKIYVYEDIRVTFTGDKVTDVQ
jgi:hypothetical protein